jgi:ABC-type uncharacterized transport system permease subunit
MFHQVWETIILKPIILFIGGLVLWFDKHLLKKGVSLGIPIKINDSPRTIGVFGKGLEKESEPKL